MGSKNGVPSRFARPAPWGNRLPRPAKCRPSPTPRKLEKPKGHSGAKLGKMLTAQV